MISLDFIFFVVFLVAISLEQHEMLLNKFGICSANNLDFFRTTFFENFLDKHYICNILKCFQIVFNVQKHFKKCKTFFKYFWHFLFRNTVNCSQTNLELVLGTICSVWRTFFGSFLSKHFYTLWNVPKQFCNVQEHFLECSTNIIKSAKLFLIVFENVSIDSEH